MKKTKIFVSFDFDHDQELKNLFCGQAAHSDTPFDIVDVSVKQALTGDWKAKALEKIKQAEQIVVICGQYTHTATGVSAELKMAQELRKPYFLLWGRSSVNNCTKPIGALSTDKIYSWTWANVARLLNGSR